MSSLSHDCRINLFINVCTLHKDVEHVSITITESKSLHVFKWMNIYKLTYVNSASSCTCELPKKIIRLQTDCKWKPKILLQSYHWSHPVSVILTQNVFTQNYYIIRLFSVNPISCVCLSVCARMSILDWFIMYSYILSCTTRTRICACLQANIGCCLQPCMQFTSGERPVLAVVCNVPCLLSTPGMILLQC